MHRWTCMIAACLGYFTRVRAMAGAEQFLALFLTLFPTLRLIRNSHHIFLSRHSLFCFSFHFLIVYLLFVVCLVWDMISLTTDIHRWWISSGKQVSHKRMYKRETRQRQNPSANSCSLLEYNPRILQHEGLNHHTCRQLQFFPPTSDDSVCATVSAGAVNTGAVVLGLAVVDFIAAFVLVSLFSLSIHFYIV